MNNVKRTIVFEDCGQDFLEWDLDDIDRVVGCRPAQASTWIDCIVMNKVVKIGKKVRFKSPHYKSQTNPCGSLILKYKVIDIKEVAPC